MSNLKPCPFCGKDPNQATAKLGDRPCFYYECENPKCRATEMGWHNTEQEAINAWNTRPIEDALRKEIAQLQADNCSLVEQVNECGVKYEKLVGVMNMALSDVDDGGYVRAGARLRKWKMEKGGQDA